MTHVIEVHTSDRQSYKRCRRRFQWSSPMRENLVQEGVAEGSATWIGTGFHFTMEDFHGYKRWSDPADVFLAYVAAFKEDELPDTVEEDAELALGMIDYYADSWLSRHPEPYETLWVDGVPQVEAEVAIDITDLLPAHVLDWAIKSCRDCRAANLKAGGGVEHQVAYVMTFDRVVIDKHDRIFGIDYKTAATIDRLNLLTNPQAAAYGWGMETFYADQNYQVAGIVWQQHAKRVPDAPRLTKNGITRDKRIATTWDLYRRALLEHYGNVPQSHVEVLNHFAALETEEGDAFIRRDIIMQNDHQRRAEQAKIILEVSEMFDPGLPMYPNPTRDCSWDCSFKAPCLMMDDGSDYKEYLKDGFVQWRGYRDDWRKRVKYPNEETADNG